MPENHLNNGNPNYKKLNDLYSIQMAKGQLYETIITTKNVNGFEKNLGNLKESDNLKSDDNDTNGSVNAAPIGVLCKNSKQIVLYLYEGTHTVNNIHHHDYFIVNITQNPIIFTKSTLEDLSDEYFEYYHEIPFLKDADAFFVCQVNKIKEITKNNDLGSSKMSIVTADVEEVVQLNSHAIPLNRGIYAVIESLIHYTRIELADNETRTSYWARINEMNRVVKKVGSLQEKEALEEIIKEIKENFKDLN
ncbi:MAG: DUF447 domain-containing protein [Methanobacteriales archaeon HGW-Methanobacteriales-1]|jgi:hypothetical protein|nr:MAG: DUF447 domain-containing protein [Methanobacteriales archaeon HGW-Methanobacteriales-1]